MDPITSTIVSALSVMGSEFLKSSVKDSYDELKAVIRNKWGATAPLTKAVEELQANPNSQGQKLVLEERVADTKAAEDGDVMQAVTKLVAKLKEHSSATMSGRDTFVGDYIDNKIIGSEGSHIGPKGSTR
jgi:hypothetical protein